ncbi:RHS repeat-associated core domain-containing protein [Sorangium sp. So ce1182]|uniref:RHS repeat-associated core domain-containing protein n=1 Tax=Sorangium sp. So ce1182 TaxID=3133334 RepID=UPI003F61784F
MARTAPIPNIPAIPGMNPGIFILGGGGAGGGTSGRGGRGSGTGQGAGGNNGGGSAEGDGRSACGSSGADGGRCPNHHGGSRSGSMTQGDPVDVVTGRVFTLPAVDVRLPGPLPLVIERSYSSAVRERDVGLGFGTTHSLAWEIEERRRTMIVWTGLGTYVELPRVAEGEGLLGPEGWLLHRIGHDIALDFADGTRYHFVPMVGGGGAQRLRLAHIESPQGARVTLCYEGAALTMVLDSAGREIRVRNSPSGRIESFEVRNATAQGRWIILVSYRYDTRGRLVAATDADGNTSSYSYDDDNLLTAYERPNGLTFFFRYDAERRCVETWGEHPGRPDPSLADDAPVRLADGTPARGVHHVTVEYFPDGGSQAADSLTTFRYDGNAHGKVERAVMGGAVFSRSYDDNGHLVAFTDALGATTRWKRDSRGRIVEETDPLGAVTRIERTIDGVIRRVVDPEGAEMTVQRTADGFFIHDPLGAVFQVRYDARGLLKETIAPDGSQTTFIYDTAGNLIEQRSASGAVARYDWDGLGRCIGVRDAGGAYTAFRYSAAGRLLTVKEADGSVTHYEYDANGNVTGVSDGRGRTSLIYGGLDRLSDVILPDGSRVAFRYDREGRLSLVRNAQGEEHRLVRRLDGSVVAERTFDGRAIHRGYDAMGRLAWVDHGLGERIDFERDACGRLTKRVHADGLEETFEHDARGDVVAATRGEVRVTFKRNALGWIVSEQQEIRGERIHVEVRYDLMGRVVTRSTSLGHSARFLRDPGSMATRVLLDGTEATVLHDVLGREVTRFLAGGGRIEKAFDEMGRVIAARVIRDGAAAMSGAPSWVGAAPPGLTADIRWAYTPTAEVARVWRSGREVLYDYDSLGRLARATRAQAPVEAFSYDAGGALFEATVGAPTRTYAPGGALERCGNTVYLRDSSQRVIEARRRLRDDGLEVTRYRWSADGLLSAVELPDGSVAHYEYDSFARRLNKRVTRSIGGEARRVAEETRFVWDTTTLVHEVRQRRGAEGDTEIEERTYCFEEKRSIPWAHRAVVVRGGERQDHGWVYYLTDDTGTPELLVDPAGGIAATIDLATWGRAEHAAGASASTPFRFRGQYADDETGLSYNRYRYYDPATGRYLSPDPVGLLGGLDAFGYAADCPTSAVDPDGLMYTVIRDGNGRVVTDGENLGAGGGVTDMDSALRNRGYRDSCAETTALNNLTRQVRAGNPRATDDQVRAEVRRRFAEEGYTMETYDGNRENFQNRSRRGNEEARVDPCPYCAAMINDLGIAGGVVGATNDRRTGRWDGRTTYRAQRRSGGGRRR